MSQRVLLLGAYANGNIGDMYQADAIAGELLSIEPTLEVFSTSPSKRSSRYPALSHEILPQSAVREPEVLNSFDLILVGGGGLLAARHAPLPEADWVASVTTTMCGLALGCAGSAPAESRAFIERCSRFSVRDEFSAQAVSSIRTDVEIVLDPIFLGRISGLDARPPPPATKGILWVPGKLVPNTLSYYSRLSREIYNEKVDAVASFNEETDKQSGFAEMFGPAVRYLHSVEQFTRAFGSRSFGASERYHGCIMALKMEIPCFGLVLRSDTVTSKISELYRRLGLRRALVRDFEDLDRKRLNSLAKSYFDFQAIAKITARERAKLHEFLRSCLAAARHAKSADSAGVDVEPAASE
jgi:polysaccharide pyruvyl transferase WcaK-like protein